MMNKFYAGVFVLFLVLGLVIPAVAADDESITVCKYCGMNRQQYAHSRIFVEYDDGTAEGFCSVHCLAVDLAVNIDKFPKSIMVGDYSTKQLINAEKAFWVLGGTKPGVMTKRAKWAFAKQNDANSFMHANGGVLVTFDEALKASYEDMNADTQMIRDRRKAKRMQMEKKP